MPHWIGNDHSVVFVARSLDDALRPQPGEADDARYFPPDDLPELLSWWHRQPIRDAVAGICGSAVWQQDLRWLADWPPHEDVFAQRDRGPLPDDLIRASWEWWCREPHPGEQWPEIERD